uniref:BART domain-containing protein n=1 Tax=Neobodo designis TaxID=312471 RepID=A0A7S1M482_NEODS|mmetsp:Transcript_32430/g.100317  ORF Transcript_32430/g.100317 Transcript_32430/m.100317 type:complete len:767 (+) Transcript_32430:40-2340(+)
MSTSTMRRAAGVRADYVGGTGTGAGADADVDPDTASEASDGESLSSEGEYERDVVSRVYRPSTVSDHSAYDIQLPASRQRASGPESSRAGKPASRVVDYAAYTKSEARAEIVQATAAATDAASPAKREKVANKALFDAAFTTKRAKAAVPDIDFTRPTGVMDPHAGQLHYDPGAYGGSAQHEIASSVHLSAVAHNAFGPQGGGAGGSRPSTAPQSSAGRRPASRDGAARGAAAPAKAATAANAAPVEDEEARAKRLEADAARRREERELGEIERLKAEAALADDADRREYLEMKALLREEALREARAARLAAAASATAETVTPAAAGESTAAADEPAAATSQPPANANGVRGSSEATTAADAAAAEAKAAHDRHVEAVAAAMAARRAGLSYDESLLEDVPEFDLAAAGALYAATRDTVRDDEAAAEEERHRRFFDAVLALEEIVASAGLARVTSRCLERHRMLFQRTKVAREAGEYTHDEHVAFREYSSKVQDYIFGRVAEAVGLRPAEFDVEDFFTRVFEEDNQDDDDDNDAAEYPLLSNDTWEVLLSLLNFESFVGLMDHYIFTRNNSRTTAAAPTTTASSAPKSAAADSSAVGSSASLAAAARAAVAAAEELDAAEASSRQTSVAGVDSFVDDGRPVRRVGSADGSTTLSRQASTDPTSLRRDSPPPSAISKDAAAPRSPAPPSSQQRPGALRPAGLTPSSSGGNFSASTGSTAARPAGGTSLNARRHGALPPVGANAPKTKGVPLVPNASLGGKKPGPKPAF